MEQFGGPTYWIVDGYLMVNFDGNPRNLYFVQYPSVEAMDMALQWFTLRGALPRSFGRRLLENPDLLSTLWEIIDEDIYTAKYRNITPHHITELSDSKHKLVDRDRPALYGVWLGLCALYESDVVDNANKLSRLTDLPFIRCGGQCDYQPIRDLVYDFAKMG